MSHLSQTPFFPVKSTVKRVTFPKIKMSQKFLKRKNVTSILCVLRSVQALTFVNNFYTLCIICYCVHVSYYRSARPLTKNPCRGDSRAAFFISYCIFFVFSAVFRQITKKKVISYKNLYKSVMKSLDNVLYLCYTIYRGYL